MCLSVSTFVIHDHVLFKSLIIIIPLAVASTITLEPVEPMDTAFVFPVAAIRGLMITMC